MSKEEKQIALFIGNDITSHLILNQVVPEIIDSDFKPTIFMVKHPITNNTKIQALQELAFFERTVVNDIIYPLLEQSAHRNGHPISPKQLADMHNIEIVDVGDVNNKEFVKEQTNIENYAGAINVRGFQKFHRPIIDAFQKDGFFINLHPGLLPEYRGVMSVCREMVDKSETCGWALHHIDEDWDTGPIVSINAHKIDPSHTVLEATIAMANTGARAIKRAIQDLESEEVLGEYPQVDTQAHYYTYPTEEELSLWAKDGIKLCNPSRMHKILTNIFVDSSMSLGIKIQDQIKEAYLNLQSEFDIANNDNSSTVIAPSPYKRQMP